MKKNIIVGIIIQAIGVVVPPLFSFFGGDYFRGSISGVLIGIGWGLIFLTSPGKKTVNK